MAESMERGKTVWLAAGVYGTYKTASSVSYVLRKQGWRTQIKQDEFGNCYVYKAVRDGR